MENVGQYITKYVKGKVPKLLFENPSDETLPYLSPDYLRGKANPEFYAEPSDKIIEVDDGEVIVLWDGSNAGEIFISKKGILGSTMVKLEFDEEEIFKPYFSYSFQYLEYFLKAKTAGSGIPHADKGVIKKLDFFKPPKPEQTAIATLLSKVDEAIEATQNSIKAAEKLKKALMQNLLSGKLKPDGTWRTDDEFYVDEKFGKVPKGWEVDRFKNKITVQYGKSQKDIVSDNGHIPIYGTGGIIEYGTKALCENESILIGRKGTIDKPYYINTPFWAVDTTYYVDSFENGNMKFLFYLLQRLNLKSLNEATGVPSLTRRTLNRQMLLFPTIEEQNEIAFQIEKYEKITEFKQTRIRTLQRLKKSLMQQLLTGKVRLPQEVIDRLAKEDKEVLA